MENIIYLDIETVSQKRDFDDLSFEYQKIWTKKIRFDLEKNPEETPSQLYPKKAAIFAEFGKIICISIGILDDSNQKFKVKSFFGHEEKSILQSFYSFCLGLKAKKNYIFCGHNIKEFDIPYICRRLLIHEIPLPSILNFQAKKPWEVHHIDTLQLWKFGDYKHFVSLDTLTTIFEIPSPKTNMDGSEVGTFYYEHNALDQIVSYCEQDIFAVFQLHRKMNQLPLFEESQIQRV
jgi:predicted PolB exonuclease-like 3'-5' exonuclease